MLKPVWLHLEEMEIIWVIYFNIEKEIYKFIINFLFIQNIIAHEDFLEGIAAV